MKSPAAPASCAPTLQAALAALELAQDMVVTTDAEGRITWHNGLFAHALGQAERGFVGLPLLATLAGPQTDAALQRQIADALAAGGSAGPLELLHYRSDGSMFRNRVVARRLDAEAEAAATLLYVMRDVGAEHALVRENAHLAELLDRVRDLGKLGIWEREHVSGNARWDRNVFRFWGLPPEGGIPPFAEVAQRVPADERADVVRRFAIAEPGHYAHHYRIELPDGSVRRIHSVWEVRRRDETGETCGVGIMVDETETWNLVQSFNQTNEQLQLALQVADIATWRNDLETGLVRFDARSARLLGIERPDHTVASDDARGWVHPDDIARVEAAVAKAMQSAAHVDVEARYRRADGHYATLLTRMAVARAPDGRALALIGVALDVTQRVESERRASELAHRLEAAAHAAGIGLWSWKLGTEQRTWNAQMWAMLGLEPEPTVPEFADWVHRCIHPEDRERVLAAPRAWFDRERTQFHSEFRVVRPDGEVRWMAARAHVEEEPDGRMLYGVLWDVTDRHAAQDALRDAYERAALTARGAGIGTWDRDLESDNSHWDEQMYRLRGIEPRHFDALHPERMRSIHPDDHPLVDAAHQRAMATDEPVAYEFRVLWPDGSTHWLASRAIRVRDERGTVRRLIGVNWDMTAQKTAQVERAEKDAALRESRAKSEFLARMSHELRTPLNAVLGFTQLMQADPEGSPTARIERLQHVRTAGEHLLALINEVLDLSSLESGQLRLDIGPMPVAGVAREALSMVSGLAAERGVALDVGTLDGVVMADRTRLRQVLINLLSNAIKFNRPEGHVSLRCRAAGDRIVVRVADTGRGLSAEQLSHLFEPFNRLGAERDGIEGTGIGLVIVKVIVERMGGAVHVASQPGRGSTFDVTLRTPEASTDPMQLGGAPRQPPIATRPALRSGRLLYIEDNPVNTLLVRELVAQRQGLELVCEPDGRSGLARARVMQPDLILVDMQLPDMDGHEVLRRLRAEPATASLPCIALSANVLTEDIERALQAGFSDYWTKPIDLHAFLAALDALFGSAKPA